MNLCCLFKSKKNQKPVTSAAHVEVVVLFIYYLLLHCSYSVFDGLKPRSDFYLLGQAWGAGKGVWF